MWFGTKDGLNRFDGYTFKIFRSDPDDSGSIGSNFIHSLYEDPNGVMWVGTENRLFKYDATTESFTMIPDTAFGQIRDIQMDGYGNLWFISGFTLVKYNEVNKNLTYYSTPQNFEATSICLTADKNLWVTTALGLLKKYNPQHHSFSSFDLFSHSPKTVSRWIENCFAAADGSLWLGTSNQGAKVFQPGDASYVDVLTYNPDKTEIFVRNFVQNTDNEIWLATESGVFIYNMKAGIFDNLQKQYNDPYSISDNAVYTFCKDKEGGIWAGTYFGGINYYPRQQLRFNNYFPKNGENALSGNVVREIHADNRGSLWIGTEDAGLNRLDTSTGKFTYYKPTGADGSISYMNIHGLLVNGDELWIGTFEHGLDVLNINTGKVIRHYSKGNNGKSLTSNFIYCIYKTDQAEILLGTTMGAYTYNASQDHFDPLPGMPLLNWYSSILKDEKGIVWGGTYGNGINFYNTISKTSGNFRYSAADKSSLSSDRVNSIFQDSDKNLWFATEGGLCKLLPAGDKFKRYNTQNGMPTDFILSMLEDSKKNLWISTSKGLVRLNPKTDDITIYTKANGLLNDQFNFSSAFKDASGKMYFGSVKGMISFHPDVYIVDSINPSVFITGFQVYNKELTIGKNGSPLTSSITNTEKISLAYDQSTFSIDFASLSFTAPEMSEYAYKMEGMDKDWTYLKTNRKVYFTNLKPGNYTFKVKSTSNNAKDNQQETRLVIEIRPPWWASVPAYILYALAGLLITLYFIRNYHNRIEEKNLRKIEHLEIEKEKELFQAKLEFFTNVAHEIKTPLTLIKGPLEKVIRKAGDVPEIKDSLRIMDRNTNRLIDLTNQLLDFRQTEIKGFGLSFVQVNIVELLEETTAGFRTLAEQKGLFFNVVLPASPMIAAVDIEAFTKILTNLLSNALKYAQSRVEVKLLPCSILEKHLTIEIGNDGYLVPGDMRDKIFEPFFRLKETQKQKGTGIGLALSRSLTDLHKGKLYLKETGGDMNVFVLVMPLHQDSLTKS
ncbi:MAG: two-component regulator propeller domain-containing protein [Bacteroidota bacterium]